MSSTTTTNNNNKKKNNGWGSAISERRKDITSCQDAKICLSSGLPRQSLPQLFGVFILAVAVFVDLVVCPCSAPPRVAHSGEPKSDK